VLLHLLLAQRLGDGLAASGFQRVDLAAGILYRERFRVIDAKPAGALLASLRVGELEGEGCDASQLCQRLSSPIPFLDAFELQGLWAFS
jgi:hypothetical protein